MSAVTLQVWNALKRPPLHHPLFRRISQSHFYIAPRRQSVAERIALLTLFSALLFISLRYYAHMIFVIIFFIPLSITALYMVLHGTIAGLYWAIRVSGAIVRERQRGTFDLLSTSPYGAFSVSWAICTGCQYHDQTFNGIGAQRVWYSRVFFLTLLLLSALTSLLEPRTSSPVHVLRIAEVVVLLGFAFSIDDIQSTVIGSLVGVIVPLFARNRLDARLGAFFGFLLLQIGAYALIGLIGFVLLPQLNTSLALEGTTAMLALPLEQFLVFFTMRELLARLLWRLNFLLLDGDVSDLRLLSRGGRLIC